MTLSLQPDPLPLRADAEGAIRVGDSQVLLDVILAEYENGATPESIARGYDTLAMADIYAVIAYYLRHRDEAQAYLDQRRQAAAALRRQIEATQPARPEFWEELKTRRAQGENAHASAAHG